MSSYQTQTIPEDPALPHLASALDVEKIHGIFQQSLFSDSPDRVIACRIERIKYKPQKNCTVCYRLIVKQNPANNEVEQRVYARFFENGGSNSRYLKACRSLSLRENEQKHLVWIPELECVVWSFPYDRKLNHLFKISDPEFIAKTALPTLVIEHYGSDWLVDSCESAVIRYVPEHTCSIRADVEVRGQISCQRKKLVAFGKHYYNDDGERVYQIMRELWDSEFRRQGKLNIPEPIAYQAQYRILWQRGVPGTMLSELWKKAGVFTEVMNEAARQVAFLHQIHLSSGLVEWGPDRWRLDLIKVMGLLTRSNPPCRVKAEALIERLIRRLRAIPTRTNAVLHGDLHLKNILADGNRVYLIDLDRIRLGDPVQDVGSFVAAILNLGMLGNLPQPIANQTIENFLRVYRETAPWRVPDSDLRWHIAAALVVERVYRSLTRLKAGRMEILTELVDLAEGILDGSAIHDWLRIETSDPANVIA